MTSTPRKFLNKNNDQKKLFTVFVSYDLSNDVSGQHSGTGGLREHSLSTPAGSSAKVHVYIVDQLPGVRRQFHSSLFSCLYASAIVKSSPTKHSPCGHSLVPVLRRFCKNFTLSNDVNKCSSSASDVFVYPNSTSR